MLGREKGRRREEGNFFFRVFRFEGKRREEDRAPPDEREKKKERKGGGDRQGDGLIFGTLFFSFAL